MYEEFTQNRIAQLRMQKNVSARDMSLSLGQNNSYINQIENKKTLPSLQGLFYICEYFGITPQQFFDEGDAYPAQLAELVEDLKKLDAASLEHIAAVGKEEIRGREAARQRKTDGPKAAGQVWDTLSQRSAIFTAAPAGPTGRRTGVCSCFPGPPAPYRPGPWR